MSISNSIRLTLNIKDPNINFSDNCVSEQNYKGTIALVFSGTLSPITPDSCPCCGCINEMNSIIKNGSKVSHIKLPRVSNRLAILKLKKQRYFCKNCNKSFSANTNLVEPNKFISRNSYHSAILNSKDKISIKDIARNHDISHSTVNNWLNQLKDKFTIRKDTLPEHLCFDEFKSVKSCSASMSFIFANAETGHVVDIVYDRRYTHLRSYFFTYTRKARHNVKTICIDMYSPYISLITSCFPNAEIICDRFHIIQLISRSLNKTRIDVMNRFPKHRTKLKRYWKLFLKDQQQLNCTDYRYFTCFKYKMTESNVLKELLSIDKTLNTTYQFYQLLLRHFKMKDFDAFAKEINDAPNNLSEPMKKSCKTLKKHIHYIKNALIYEHSNGILEGTNNLIKVIKRIAFGYRSYDNFRTRILLITNTMVKCEH